MFTLMTELRFTPTYRALRGDILRANGIALGLDDTMGMVFEPDLAEMQQLHDRIQLRIRTIVESPTYAKWAGDEATTPLQRRIKCQCLLPITGVHAVVFFGA